MPSYTKTKLYGGAVNVSIPTDFADVSIIRDVPDHQEVYLSRTGLTSLIFDIIERAEPPEHPSCTTDAEALKYHFEDIVEVGYARDARGSTAGEVVEETKTWANAQAVFLELPSKPANSIFATQHPLDTSRPASSATNSKSAPDFTAILLILLRLPEQKTDILITINVPHVAGERGYDPKEIDFAAGKNGLLIEEAMEMRTEVLKTFKVVDWDLFAG